MSRVTARTVGWLGVLFVLLLFISAGMVTLPSSAQNPQAIADFYAANRSIVLIAQTVGLLAVPLFIAFVFGLEKIVTDSSAFRRIGPIGLTGILVGIVSVGMSVPVIVLALTTAGLPLWV